MNEPRQLSQEEQAILLKTLERTVKTTPTLPNRESPMKLTDYTDPSGNTFQAPELLPCPFCGGKAELMFSVISTRVRVKCTICRIAREDTGLRYSFEQLAKWAIQDWNKRVKI